MAERKPGLETRAVHAGAPDPRIERSAVVPIFQSAVYEHPDVEGDYGAVRYPRLNNLPNHVALAGKLAALEGGEDALVTSSGMAAISTVLLESLGGGGHLLVQDQLYGGTHSFVRENLPQFGIEYDSIPGDEPDVWRSLLRKNTRAIYVETLTNPLLRVADHRAVVAFAREHDLVSIVDNTFATPVNFRPPENGFDVTVHSCTKYLNGHSDLVAGAVVASCERLDRVRRLLGHLGGTLDPHACFLLDRGIKTLVLRVRKQSSNALALAERLAAHAAVTRVNYPGLVVHPDHARARELFDGFGGMFSFELGGGRQAASQFIEGLKLAVRAPSLGGVETLVTRPVTTSHAGLSAEERVRLGIGAGLIRVSVGIEDEGDLIHDFETALSG